MWLLLVAGSLATASPTATPPTATPTNSPTATPSAPPCVSAVTDGGATTLTVSCNTSDSLTQYCDNCLGTPYNSLNIQKDPSVTEEVFWTNFTFHYSTHGQAAGTILIIQGVNLYTETIDAYAIHSKVTKVFLNYLTIEGYSGRPDEIQGGAMRIIDADYCDVSPSIQVPVITQVHVTKNCRGFRIQDSSCAIVTQSTATDCSDNAFYFASGSYTSADGCHDSVFDHCTATNSGQVGFMVIGGSNCTISNSVVDTTRGAGIHFYNHNSTHYVDGTTCVNCNTHHTQTPWQEARGSSSGTDDGNGASLAVVVASTDTGAVVNVANSIFTSGGVLNHSTSVDSIVFYNNAPSTIVFTSSTYEPDNYGTPPFIDTYADTSGLEASPECYTVVTNLATLTRTITVTCDTSDQLEETRSKNIRTLVITGIPTNGVRPVWTNFKFDSTAVPAYNIYGDHFGVTRLEISNLELRTDTETGFAIAGIYTAAYIDSVRIEGYSCSGATVT